MITYLERSLSEKANLLEYPSYIKGGFKTKIQIEILRKGHIHGPHPPKEISRESYSHGIQPLRGYEGQEVKIELKSKTQTNNVKTDKSYSEMICSRISTLLRKLKWTCYT